MGRKRRTRREKLKARKRHEERTRIAQAGLFPDVHIADLHQPMNLSGLAGLWNALHNTPRPIMAGDIDNYPRIMEAIHSSQSVGIVALVDSGKKRTSD